MSFERLKARWQLLRLDAQEEARRRKETLSREAPAVFERFGVRKAVLFGSTQRQTPRKGSDIDLLVMPVEPSDYWRFKRALEEALDYSIDLYTQTDDPVFVDKVLSRGEVVYEG